jgi:hypothetical protein
VAAAVLRRTARGSGVPPARHDASVEEVVEQPTGLLNANTEARQHQAKQPPRLSLRELWHLPSLLA